MAKRVPDAQESRTHGCQSLGCAAMRYSDWLGIGPQFLFAVSKYCHRGCNLMLVPSRTQGRPGRDPWLYRIQLQIKPIFLGVALPERPKEDQSKA